MDSRKPLSAFVICKDEARTIGACLESLAGFDDIVVVDSGSTDGTLDIVRELATSGMPIRLFERDWPGYAAQKQFALEQCRHDWCLNLDADEKLDDALRAAIHALPTDMPGVAAYAVRRADWLPGYGYPPRGVHVRSLVKLVHGSRARYDTSQAVHEGFILDGRVGKITTGRILHDRLISISEETPKIANYARLKARALHASGRRASLASIGLNPAGRFLKSYLLQRYFLCGRPGLIYAGMLAVYVFLTEAMLYRLEETPDLPEE
ncbi:MAG: glycosyltransferase family 2 protein [Rhizobiaceae bacterium]|nr:glycosyltransferase family 2 protein [Rhizobiaceae bacterium]MCV0408605.1 glycosyltransferase family 2 protein [Rhizobiaceae bacterium]